MRLALLLFISVSLVACGSGGGAGADANATADADTTNDARRIVDANVDQADASVTSVDCASLPSAPSSQQMLDKPRGYHGLAITADGAMIGSDTNSLIKSSYDNVRTTFVPGIGAGEQMDWLPNGDLVFATDDGSLTRITAAGGLVPIATDVFAYGVVLGPDNKIYAVGDWGSRIVRVDPTSGAKEVLLTYDFGKTVPHSIDFSPNGKRMYIGTIGDGSVWYVDFDDDMNIVGGQKKLATVLGDGQFDGWHDGVGVDACGNLYIPDYTSSSVYKVTPTGEVSLFSKHDSVSYPHGLIWGSGQHGWRADALYLPQPYNDNTVLELVIGVPSRDFTGEVLNKPAMK